MNRAMNGTTCSSSTVPRTCGDEPSVVLPGVRALFPPSLAHGGSQAEPLVAAVARPHFRRVGEVAEIIALGRHDGFVPEMCAHPVDGPAFHELADSKFMPQIVQAGAEHDVLTILPEAR